MQESYTTDDLSRLFNLVEVRLNDLYEMQGRPSNNPTWFTDERDALLAVGAKLGNEIECRLQQEKTTCQQ